MKNSGVTGPMARVPVRVAVLDNDAPLLSLMGMVLEEGGYEPVLLQSVDALQVLLQSEGQVALIVMDVHLERWRGGVELLRALRANRRTRNIPVIFCTGDTHFVAEEAPHLGCLAILKPFDIDEFVSVVRAQLAGA